MSTLPLTWGSLLCYRIWPKKFFGVARDEAGDPFVGRLYFWLEKKLSTGLSTELSTSKQPDTIDTL